MDELGAGDAAAGAFLASILRGETRAQSAGRCVRAYAHHSRRLVVGHDARFHRRLRFVLKGGALVADPVEVMERGLEQARLVAIVRLVDHSNVVEIVGTLCDAGVRFLEITVERPEGFRSIERVVEALGNRATIGAGTVLSVATVAQVADAGARFIVTPNTNPKVIAASCERGLMVLPGAFTPTEVAAATSAGTRFVKLFPASTGGVAHLKALRGPFPGVKFVPTGGVTSENALSWLDAGAAAVAMGSNLVPGSGELEGLFERARQAVACTAVLPG